MPKPALNLEDRRQNREIDGVLYSVVPLPFGTGIGACARTVKLLSPVFATVVGNNINQALLFERLPDVLNEEDLEYFAEVFGGSTKVQEESGEMVPLTKARREFHFAGNYLSFFKWVGFCMEVNFANFFDGAKSGENNILAALTKVFPKQAEATPK